MLPNNITLWSCMGEGEVGSRQQAAGSRKVESFMIIHNTEYFATFIMSIIIIMIIITIAITITIALR